ncbi:radical SAM protein [Eggerthella sp. NSJ-70]|uniref:Radical SAM protein n=1 Tax=Eggerthella hominis TaxID=2763043 RepID=A0ABR7BMY1_9ACTN|nr:radical SAM protein [Eggerthella hominis]MBC5582961.1 radical SAM protein [Eggerthella hominis]
MSAAAKDADAETAPLELAEARARYDEAYAEFVQRLEARGIRFARRNEGAREADGLRESVAAKGVERWYRGASLRRGRVSPACRDCVTARRSKTFELTARCHRRCFFCLNSESAGAPEPERPWREEMQDVFDRGVRLEHIALSGGEPLLLKEEAFSFFERAKTLFPSSWTRLYTSGDLLADGDVERLRSCGLDEIRFSFKQDDPPEAQAHLLDRVEEAKRLLAFVAVEMPVFPDSFEYMRDLMVELDRRGVDSINLLEFCFPFTAWEAFERRGYLIANPPLEVLYPYGYAGGLPVAGSELECLRLLDFACEARLGMGVHYCSLANKHRAEMFAAHALEAQRKDGYVLDADDFFLKACKVFGREAVEAQRLLREMGARFSVDENARSLQCEPRLKAVLDGAGLHTALSFCVKENRSGQEVLREVALR